MSTLRVSLEPAWILHRRPFRESSLLLDLLTANHGRISAVGRGQRQGRQAGLFQPLRPLRVDFVRRGELATLGRCEPAGPAVALAGMPLWSAFYLNELLLRLLAVDDPHGVGVFSLYSGSLQALRSEAPAVVLRHFEYALLDELGFGFDAEQIPQQATGLYWDASRGLVPGAHGAPVAAVRALLAGARDSSILPSRDLLAAMLRMLLGERPLRSAVMLRELVALSQRSGGPARPAAAPESR